MASKAQDFRMANSSHFHFSTTEYYSTLQVDRSLEEKQPLPECGLEPIKPPLFIDLCDAPELSPYNETPRTFNSTSSIEPDASLAHNFGTLLKDKEGGNGWKGGRTICGIPRKTFWLLSVVKIFMIAVVIAVPVSLVVRGKTSSARTHASNVSPINPASISNTSSLASIAWNDTNGIMQYRVYWQGEDNIIRESGWNGTATMWRVSNSAIGSAKPNSPLIAVVSDPADYPIHIDVGAISASGTIVTWFCTGPDSADGVSNFTTGPLITPTIAPASDSTLAAARDYSSETLLLVYQDTTGQLALGNLTASGWLWSTLSANPVPGTGLALDVRSMGNVTRNIAVYYQLDNDYLTVTLFNGTTYQWETRESDPIGPIAANASLASLDYGSTPVGVTLDEVVLSTSSNGTAVNSWYGQTQTFDSGEYSTVLGQSTSLATNMNGHAYGLQDGTVKDFKIDDMLMWSFVGNVTGQDHLP